MKTSAPKAPIVNWTVGGNDQQAAEFRTGALIAAGFRPMAWGSENGQAWVMFAPPIEQKAQLSTPELFVHTFRK